MRILITGAKGMLAGHLIPLILEEKRWTIVLSDLLAGEVQAQPILPLDITDLKAAAAAIEDLKPDWVVNCAAFTAVDLAETKKETAFRVNAAGPGNLARALSRTNGRLLHISSDYVFGGPETGDRERTPYREDERTAPCGLYGLSKHYGDELVSAALPERHLIVRTSWLHGLNGPSFVASILKAAGEREELRVVNDQIGSPTWAGWLAEVLVKLISREAGGVFHASSRGGISWFDFAAEILRLAESRTRLNPQTTAELNRPAPRPAYSTLSIEKLERFLGEPCPDWRTGVREHLKALKIV